MSEDPAISGFLAACPGLRPGWVDRLRPEEVHGDAPTDIGHVGNYLRDCYQRGELSEFPAAFAHLERCLIEGSSRNDFEAAFVLWPLHLRLEQEPTEAKVFRETWLGPYSRIAWDGLEWLAARFSERFAEFPTPHSKRSE